MRFCPHECMMTVQRRCFERLRDMSIHEALKHEMHSNGENDNTVRNNGWAEYRHRVCRLVQKQASGREKRAEDRGDQRQRSSRCKPHPASMPLSANCRSLCARAECFPHLGSGAQNDQSPGSVYASKGSRVDP